MAHEKRHPWMQTLNVAAVCPQCREPELRRSHARSFFERLIKDHTLKRPFRCHACGWRGWCDETSLTFPITPEKLQATRTIAADDSIPSFDLDAPPAAGRHFTPQPSHIPFKDDVPPRMQAPAPEVPTTSADPLPAPHVPEPSPVPLPAPHVPEPSLVPAHVEDVPAPSPDPAPPALDTEAHLSVERVDDDFHNDDRHRTSACPRCGKMNLHRSHSRSFSEKLRKLTTLRRPYRCHSCGWRGWVRKD